MSNYRYEGYGLIRDLKTNILYDSDDTLDLLEEKDQRIKELEEENQQLKQSQKQKAISELGKVENWCEEHKYSDDFDYIITYEYDEEDGSGNTDYLKDYIDNQIKELGGGE